jgi:hypothetical protein
MSGYVPLFSSLTTGTLCGKWPDIGLWPIILSLADKHGVVDVTPDYLARITGLALDDVLATIARFCEPDPYSRSAEESGRRLLPVDHGRPWGWRIVNHAKYREQARKRQWDIERTASGRDADRKRREREGRAAKAEGVPTCPDKSRLSPLSDSDADADINPRSAPDGARGAAGRRGKAKGTDSTLPADFALTPDRKAYAERNLPGVNAAGLFENFALWARSEGKTCRDWNARWQRWVRNCRTDSDDPRFAGKYPKQSGGVAWQ